MVGADGPKLIEFNVRFGDPEAEAILARLDDDLLEFLLGCAQRRFAGPRAALLGPGRAHRRSWRRAAIPERSRRARRSGGSTRRRALPGVSILHAGTRREGETLVADGGRVLAVTALGRDVVEAQSRAYAAVDRMDWPGGFCRRDIGWRAIGRRSGS